MTPQRVTMITLGVKDLAASRAFYKALGWVFRLLRRLGRPRLGNGK